MLVGLLMILVGGIGTPLVRAYIANDRYYTYHSPLTGHEVLVLLIFSFFLIVLVLGVCMMVFAVIKKRNADHLTRISHLQKGGTMGGILLQFEPFSKCYSLPTLWCSNLQETS